MLYGRLSDAVETVVLHQFGDSAKPGLHVEGQTLKLVSNAIIE